MQLCSESACSYPGRSDKPAHRHPRGHFSSKGLDDQPLGAPIAIVGRERTDSYHRDTGSALASNSQGDLSEVSRRHSSPTLTCNERDMVKA